MNSNVEGLFQKGKDEWRDLIPFRFFDDDGTEVTPDLVPKPGLCLSCMKDDDPREEVLCTLTRYDQKDEREFRCFAYTPRSG